MEKSHQGNVLSNPTKWEKWTLNDDDDDDFALLQEIALLSLASFCQIRAVYVKNVSHAHTLTDMSSQ